MNIDLAGIVWAIVHFYGGLLEMLISLVILLAALVASILRKVRWWRSYGLKIGSPLFLLGGLNAGIAYILMNLDLSLRFRKRLDELAFPSAGMEFVLLTVVIVLLVMRERRRRTLDNSHLRAVHRSLPSSSGHNS